MISVPAEIADASVVTPRIRSPSTITMAFVQSFPLASQSFPKRTALIVLALGFSCAQIPHTHNAPRTAARKTLVGFMARSPLRLHAHTLSNVCLVNQLPMESNREELRTTSGGG